MIELTDDDLWTIAPLVGKVQLQHQAIYRAGMAAGIERSAKAAEDCKPMMYRQVPRNMKLGYDEACNNCAAAIRALDK